MAKYSTGDSISNSNEDDSCAVCGSQDDLQLSKIGERRIKTCVDCRQESDKISRSESETHDSQGDGVGGYTITNPDSSWVEDDRPDYGNRTPYLVDNYDEIVENAVKEFELSRSEICEDMGLDEEDLVSVINGNAVSDSVGMSVITTLEENLDVSIEEEV